MTSTLIDLQLGAGIATLTLNRPDKRNAMSDAMRSEFTEALERVAADKAIRALVLTGAGKGFCAGGDIAGMERRMNAAPGDVGFNGWHRQQGVHHAQSLLHTMPKPVIAAVNGAAYGGGFGIALACDLIVAAEHARFAIPEVQRGLVGVGVTSRVALRLPPAVVLELALTGEPIDARRAHELGLVNHVVPGADLRDAALAIAARIAANGPLAVRAAKEVAVRAMHLHDNVDLAALRELAVPVHASEDSREGRAAFLERRTPRFSGR